MSVPNLRTSPAEEGLSLTWTHHLSSLTLAITCVWPCAAACLTDSESLNICCLLLRFIWMGLLRDYDYKPSCGPSFQALLKMYIKWCCISESPGVATYDAATMTLRTMGSGLGTDHLHTTILGRNTWKTRLGDPFHPSVKLANNDHIGFLRIRTPHEH